MNIRFLNHRERLIVDIFTFDTWVIIGFLAQGLFASRFFVQWIASERKGRSVVPVQFWFLSLGGGLLLLFYAIHRHDPVFILGQAGGLAIYGRNLMLIYRKPRAEEIASSSGNATPSNGGDQL